MWDLFMAKLGPKHCPWCNFDRDKITLYDRFIESLPRWFLGVVVMSGYDHWVGTHGLRMHSKHYEEDRFPYESPIHDAY